MRQAGPLFFPLLHFLLQIKAAAACLENCSSVNVTATVTAVGIDNSPGNFTISNVTFANGTLFLLSPSSNLIEGLSPGVQYIINFHNGTESCCKAFTTKPSVVSNLKAVNISTTEIHLTWENNDTESSNYNYSIKYNINGSSSVESLPLQNKKSATITSLQPGTLYEIRVFAAIAGIEGDSAKIENYTKPSVVSNLKAVNISTTEIHLTWENNDTESSNYNYSIKYNINGSSSVESLPLQNKKSATITSLQPGTLYEIRVFAAIAGIEGDSAKIENYTKPSVVSNLQAINISTTEIHLTWKNNDTESSNYNYSIKYNINGSSSVQSMPLQNETSATISSLQPGTLYEIRVFAEIAGIEGDSAQIENYTKPSVVSNLKAVNISTTEIHLTWENNDIESSNYNYSIKYNIIGNSSVQSLPLQNEMSATITSLQPGTLYEIRVFAAIAGIEGDSAQIENYTKPSVVSNLKAVNISTTEIHLTWENNDTESSNYNYSIKYNINGSSSVQSLPLQNETSATITSLQPGTLYEIRVFAEIAKIEGESAQIENYTKPSPVFDLQVVNISTTEVNLTWQNNDTAAPMYTYIVIAGEDGSQITTNDTYTLTNTAFGARITALNPGTSYVFTVFPQAGDKTTEGNRVNITNCTDAASVSLYECTPLPKQPALMLQWNPPTGNYSGFRIEIFNATQSWEIPCSSSTPNKTIQSLDYYTSYNVSIKTCSCGKESLPVQKTCQTSITDPPVPVQKPEITSITHNSFEIKFYGFESKNGPIEAYALIISTSKEGDRPPNSCLRYTFNDFKEKKTKTYVTYVQSVEQMKAFSSRMSSTQYEVEAGNKLTTNGYYNAPLEPLGSYWVSIAGFTKIELENKSEVIIENRSYVSFTDYSQRISLPQNPEIIIGAVVGCFLGALAIAAVVGFIFWSRRRKDGRNSDLPISPIKPRKSKSIKVEHFESYFKKQQADSNCGFAEEYEELRSVGVNQPKFAAELPENRGKNRYNNVLPYDISRVKLSIQNHPTDDYINANYMPGYNSKKEFIAAQGPLPNTVKDFWRMIWEKNIYAIVMLTKCVEQGRTKCEEYWPDKGTKHYGDITVSLISEFVLPEWTIRDFTVEDNNATESHTVRQFHFTSWPDHGVPETTDLLINFRHLVQENISQNPPDSPTLVHCSAGVGRTGTFIAIDRLIQQMEMDNVSDVYGVVYDLRMHRPLMVQTEDQYVFLNQCVLDIIKSQRNKKSDLIYQNTTAVAIYENFTPIPTFEKANGYHA
ncbi:receptor-type tyrosine-protein phosphatase eta [Carettochelys insculpta]|uniref:receptor-type tyrosine-protein phosphatase eta n=1 Tax=Carettochelys insculpta TaxID=44489 RepID=UPI003EBFC29D